MPLDASTAAAVARRHGLTLGDAAALQRLADTADEADALAAQFADPDAVTDAAYEAIRTSGGAR
jgi:hypothetical protein